MYRVAVCEDVALECEAIAAMCAEILTALEVSYEMTCYSSADDLAAAMAEGARFELLCLDILMEGKSGMQLARELREQNESTSILFITGSEAHLKEGYAVRPIQYLFKPIDPNEMREAIATDVRLRRERQQKLSFRCGGKTVIYTLEDIMYLESKDHLLMVQLKERRDSHRVTLTQIEQLLPVGRFCRCHNSYIVNLAHITKIGRRELVLSNGDVLPVSRSRYEDLQNCFVQFLNRL